jgi:glycosyltransferase involved in cell wall biosynthesis
MIAGGFHEVIVVDYDCPQGTSEWVRTNYPSVKLVKVNNERLFNLPKARNFGATHSVGDMLCFVDADIEIASGFLEWFITNFSKKKFYLLEQQKLRQGYERLKGLYGLVVCTREQFEAIGGYDDVMAGWGGEDLDFYWRLKKAGYDAKTFPLHIVNDVIDHDDFLRTSYYSEDKTKSDLAAGFYIAAKYKIEEQLPIINIPRELKELLYNQAVAACEKNVIEFGVPSISPSLSLSLTKAEMLAIKKTMRKTIKPPSKTKKTKKLAKWKIHLYLTKLIRRCMQLSKQVR